MCHKTVWHYAPHLRRIATHYLGKLKIRIFCRYPAIIPDMEENANKLRFNCTDFNSSARVTAYAVLRYDKVRESSKVGTFFWDTVYYHILLSSMMLMLCPVYRQFIVVCCIMRLPNADHSTTISRQATDDRWRRSAHRQAWTKRQFELHCLLVTWTRLSSRLCTLSCVKCIST